MTSPEIVAQVDQDNYDGINAAKQGNFEEAYGYFGRAIDALGPDDPDATSRLKRTETVRNLGFTAVRQGLAAGAPDVRKGLFAQAEERLDMAQTLTDLNTYSFGDSRERRQNHYETMGVRGRFATVRAATATSAEDRDRYLAEASNLYEAAYTGHQEAGHAYFTASTIVHGLTNARIAGDGEAVRTWKSRLVSQHVFIGLVRAAVTSMGAAGPIRGARAAMAANEASALKAVVIHAAPFFSPSKKSALRSALKRP